MGGKINYTMVGLFVVVLVIGMVGGALLLSGRYDYKKYQTYLVYINEAVSGLSIEAPVKYNGVDVGFVSNIDLNPNDFQQVILTLKIKEGTPIAQSTIATLMAQGVTGLTYVGLKSTQSKSPLLRKTPGKPYPVIQSEPSLLMQLDTALREVTDNLRSISSVFLNTFDKQNQLAFKESLQNIQNFTKVLSDNKQAINAILNNTSKASKKLPMTLEKINEMTELITQTAKSINGAMSDSRAAMQNISNQTVPEFNQTLNKLDQLMRNLEDLTAELKRDPSILLKGKQLPPPGPGEWMTYK